MAKIKKPGNNKYKASTNKKIPPVNGTEILTNS